MQQLLLRALSILSQYVIGGVATLFLGALLGLLGFLFGGVIGGSLVVGGVWVGGVIGGVVGILVGLAIIVQAFATKGGEREIKPGARVAAESNKARSETLENFWQRADRARLLKPKLTNDKNQRH